MAAFPSWNPKLSFRLTLALQLPVFLVRLRGGLFESHFHLSIFKPCGQKPSVDPTKTPE